jgi:hypothetical protein
LERISKFSQPAHLLSAFGRQGQIAATGTWAMFS